MGHLSDEELVERFRGDPQSSAARACVDELFGRYHARVGAWCYRFTGDRAAAADLAQEVFLRVWRRLEMFRGESKFSTWLFSVTRNHCLNDLKARSVRPEHTADLPLSDLPDHRDGAEAALEQMSTAQEVRTLLAETLDETERQVMTLHYAEEMTLETITRLLGLTNASGAKAYIVSSRRKLAGAVARWKARQDRKAL
jgi:RNA polymerase sigma-70 factor (ECF subfamily)